MTVSVDVSWTLNGITMGGTLLRPDGDGPFPAVVLVAGSGPTDRDWCSPLLSGSNGSGRLFAEAFAPAGIASIRYDKRASGPHAMENLPRLIGKLSMQSHLDELAAAVRVLAAQDFVDRSRIVGLGNSEGALHVLHYVTNVQDVPFVGIVLAAPPGRPIQDVLLSQLALQAAQVPGGTQLLPRVEEAAARYAAGQPMHPDPELPDARHPASSTSCKSIETIRPGSSAKAEPSGRCAVTTGALTSLPCSTASRMPAARDSAVSRSVSGRSKVSGAATSLNTMAI